MTQYNDLTTITSQIRALRDQVRQLQTQPRLISSSIDRGGTQSSDYNGTGISDPGTTGWFIGTDETTGVGYAVINNQSYPASASGLITLDAAFTYNTGGYQAQYIVRDGVVFIYGARVTRAAAALSAAAGTDYILNSSNPLPPEVRPSFAQETTTNLHYGVATPTFAKFVVNTNGNMFFRPSAAGTLGTGSGNNYVNIPPIAYPLI